MSDYIHDRRRRLELRCRSRSCLEADLLFARARRRVFGFSAAQLDELESLLALEDRELIRRVAHSRRGKITDQKSVFRLLLNCDAS